MKVNFSLSFTFIVSVVMVLRNCGTKDGTLCLTMAGVATMLRRYSSKCLEVCSDGVLLRQYCGVASVTKHGQSRDDVWPEL